MSFRRPSLLIVALFGIWAAGAAMRFYALDRQSLWDDELSSIHTSALTGKPLLAQFLTTETHPPLYFAQLRFWRVIGGESLSALRANSAFWGMVSLFLIWLVARRYGGDQVGVLAAALLAFSPFHLAYSQELRPYAFGIALMLASLLALEAVLKKPTRFRFVALALSWLFLLYTHYWGAFIVAAEAAYGWMEPTRRKSRRAIALSLGVAIGWFVPWMPVLLSQIHAMDSLGFWAPSPGLKNLAWTFLSYSGIYFRFASGAFIWSAPAILNVLVAAAWGGSVGWALVRGPRAARWILILGLGLPFLMGFWMPSLYVWYRYPVLLYPAFLLLASWTLATWPAKAVRITLVTLTIGAGLWGCQEYFTDWQKANAKSVVSYLHDLKLRHFLVVRPAYFGELFRYYDQGVSPVIDQHLLDAPEKRAALRGLQLVLISFDVPSDPIAEALRKEYRVMSSQSFPGYGHLGIRVEQLMAPEPMAHSHPHR